MYTAECLVADEDGEAFLPLNGINQTVPIVLPITDEQKEQLASKLFRLLLD